jgi:hypothetical protein
MSTESRRATGYGFDGELNWVAGGAIGGIAGSLLFGVLLWIVDPAIVTETIPAIYGFDPAETTGWAFHLLHGLTLGIVFGHLVTRETILGTITADSQIDWLDDAGLGARLALAGSVYGLAVWAILPVIAATVWFSIGGTVAAFPGFAVESLAGHLLYGALLGALFAALVEIESEAERAETPFDDFDGADVRR